MRPDASLTHEVMRSLCLTAPPAKDQRKKKGAYAWCSRCGAKTETETIPAPAALLCGKCRKWARKYLRKKFLEKIND